MEIELFSSQFFVALFSIIVLDLVLAGDNAVVIAMASNRLPAQLRTRAIYVGTAGAVLVRLIMTFFAVEMLTVPYLQALGGLVLLPIAVKLMRPSKEAHVKAADTFAGAVKTIIVADAAMGLDNVLAIAGASQGHFLLVVIGAAILGWTAGTMIAHDHSVGPMILNILPNAGTLLPAACAGLVCAIGGRNRSA